MFTFAVTSICAHPTIRGAIISGSTDGSVCSTDFFKSRGANELLVQEYSPITSIDCDVSPLRNSTSSDMLITTKLGVVRIENLKRL